MNERIQQLWRQVKFQECDCGCNPDEFLRLRFAELIVRECSAVALNIGCGDIEDELLKHFGVKE